MEMEIEIVCGHNDFEWYGWQKKLINTDDFIGFEIHYGINWKLYGIRLDKDNNRIRESLSATEISIYSLNQFIKLTDKPILKITNDNGVHNFREQLQKVLA